MNSYLYRDDCIPLFVVDFPTWEASEDFLYSDCWSRLTQELSVLTSQETYKFSEIVL